jgi:uncharacterized protein
MRHPIQSSFRDVDRPDVLDSHMCDAAQVEPDADADQGVAARPDPHRDLVRALHEPACYPHPVQRIEHIETHISDVFLTGEFAYKLKKPLDLGFLDFSTLEKRRACCEEELRLNRRLAPDLYLAVVPITGTLTRPRLGGEGVAFDYAVQMRQFAQSGILERVLERGEFTAVHIDQIAELVAAFHAALPRAPSDGPFGNPESIMAPALQNFEQLAPLLEAAADRAALERLRNWTRAQHTALGSVFAQRLRDGFVRECHGDLHLGNMVLIDDRVRVFDCIEFNPALRWIDVISEAAFLAMDLSHRRRQDFAFRFLNRYLEVSGDYDGVLLLRYYMVYRALVRAKVAAMRSAQANLGPAARHTLQAKCRAHVALAEQLTGAARPVLLILHGLSGSGKTTLSQVVLEAIGAIRLRSDLERKRMLGLPSAARTNSGLGAGLYTAASGIVTYERIANLAGQVLRGGYPVLVDAAFLERAQRQRFRSLARALNVSFAILHAQAKDTTMERRLALRAAAGMDASEATEAVLQWQMRTQEPLAGEEQAETFVFDTDRLDQRQIADQTRRIMQQLTSAGEA